jgi:hypothetical protein
MTHARNQECARHVASRIERLVLPKLTIKERDADDSHGDGSKCRSEEWPRSSDEDLGRINGPGCRRDTKQNSSDREDG